MKTVVCSKYKLTGIVVHSGQASGGHYYSYILHRLVLALLLVSLSVNKLLISSGILLDTFSYSYIQDLRSSTFIFAYLKNRIRTVIMIKDVSVLFSNTVHSPLSLLEMGMTRGGINLMMERWQSVKWMMRMKWKTNVLAVNIWGR